MVFSKHLYMVILSYILLIIAVAGAGIALIITHTALILGCLFLIISLFFIRALVKQLNKFNAKIRIFLDAMEDKESMILFNEQSADKEMNALSHSLNRINELACHNEIAKPGTRELLSLFTGRSTKWSASVELRKKSSVCKWCSLTFAGS